MLVGIIGGLSMAAVAGWRRTNSAMERFFVYHHAANAYTEGLFEKEAVEAIPGIDAAIGGDYFLLTPIDDSGQVHPEHLGQVSPFSSDSAGVYTAFGRPILVDGALPDPSVATEVAVDEEMAELYDLQAGDHLNMQGYGMDQVEQIFENIGTLEPTGERFDFTVTAIIRSPQDVVPHQKVPDVVYMGSAEVLLGPAFDAAHRGVDIPSLGALFGDAGPAGALGFDLRVDFSETTPEAMTAAIEALDPEAFVDFSASDAQRAAEEASRSIRLQATLLLALGAVVAIGGIVLITQALRRQLEADRDVQRSLRALGAHPFERGADRGGQVRPRRRRQRRRGRGRRHRRLPAHAGGARPSGRDRSGDRRRPDRAGARGVGTGGARRGLRGRQRLARVRRRAAGPIVEG